MFPRVLLGYVLTLPILVTLLANRVGEQSLAVTMSASVAGSLQLFYDSGAGFNEAQSSIVPVMAWAEAREYRLRLPPGKYRRLRVDPGHAPGRYVIQRAAIVGPDGSTHAVIPLVDLVPVSELSAIERSRERLVLEASGGDPQLVYSPAAPVRIEDNRRMLGWPLVGFLSWWIGAIILLGLLERLLRPLIPLALRTIGRLSRYAEAKASLAILLVATLSTLLATYPVLFLGRSFVAPNNSVEPMLYSELPFVPGSADLEVEDVRESDVSAAMYAFVPYSWVQRQALASAEVPLWNRYNAAGRPLWAQGQTFLIDPLHWLTFATPDPSLGWDLKFVAHRFVFALGVGMAALAATGGWLPSAIAAGGAPFLGFYSYRLNHPAAFTLTYAPWVLLAWFLLASAKNPGERVRAAALLSAAMALVLFASPPKEAAAMLFGLAIAGAGALCLSAGGWKRLAISCVAAAFAGVTFVLLTAPHWLPFLGGLKSSVTFYDRPYAIFAGARDAVSFFLGPLTPGPVRPGLHTLCLILMIAAMTAPVRLFKRPLLFSCMIAAVALGAIAFGVVPARFLLRIPFVANIHHLDDVFLTAALTPLLVSSAAGAAALVSAGPVRAALVAILTGLVGWWLVTRVAYLAPWDGFEPWAALLVLAPATALPCCVAARQFRRAPVLSLLASVATVVVVLLPGGLHVKSGLAPLDSLLVQPRLRVPLARTSPAVDAVHGTAADPGRTVGVDWSLFPGSQALYALEGIGGPDALRILAFQELVKAAGIRRQGWLTWVTVPDVSQLAPLLDLLNVRFFLARSDDVLPGSVDVPVRGFDRLKVCRRPTAWPRAFFVDDVATYADAADLLRQVAVRREPFAAVQSSDSRAIGLSGGVRALTPSGNVVPADRYRLTVNTTSFHVRAPGPGVAVLSETFLPDDFHATLNGRRASYFRVNHAFKALVIPSAGDWEVRFEYRPAHWELSLAMAGAGIAMLISLCLLSTRPRYAVGARFKENPAAQASS